MMSSSYKTYYEEREAELYPDYRSAVYGSRFYGLGLSGFEDNLKRVFSLIPGAGTAYSDLVQLIESKAKEGAEQAIPRIKSEVEATVKPFVIAAMLLGFGGFLFGISTYLQYRRGS
jgi:hypothetical protein